MWTCVRECHQIIGVECRLIEGLGEPESGRKERTHSCGMTATLLWTAGRSRVPSTSSHCHLGRGSQDHRHTAKS